MPAAKVLQAGKRKQQSSLCVAGALQPANGAGFSPSRSPRFLPVCGKEALLLQKKVTDTLFSLRRRKEIDTKNSVVNLLFSNRSYPVVWSNQPSFFDLFFLIDRGSGLLRGKILKHGVLTI
jgi:hypothetical protein